MTEPERMPPRWENCRQAIRGFVGVVDDDFEAVSEETAASITEIANSLESLGFPPPVRTCPTVAGGIVIEWQSKDSMMYIEHEDRNTEFVLCRVNPVKIIARGRSDD